MNPFRRLLKPTVLAGCAALGAVALGQTQGYVQKTRTIHAAVLLLDADKPNGKTYGQTATPFAFYNLDQATGVKPAGWSFVNPFAPGQITPDIYYRYGEAGYALPDPTTTTPSPVRKQNGAYWTERLSQLSDAQMASYDVLLIAPQYNLSLNPTERERLRRFVDGGGVLWVEVANGTVDSVNNLPYSIAKTTATGTYFRDNNSPLIKGVRQVSDSDLNAICDGSSAAIAAPNIAGDNYASFASEFLRYRGVAYVGNATATTPVIAQARLGDGAIVVTTRGAALKLNEDTLAGGSTANVAYTGRAPNLNAQGRAAARLAVNIVGLTGGFRQAEAGSHKTNSDTTDTPAPVLSRFTVEGNYGPGNALSVGPNGVTSQPVVYKGYLVASINGRIAVFDAVPGRDLDGDGDPDDGIVDASGNVQNSYRDVSVGKNMDLIWYSGVIDANGISGPVCAEVPDTAAALPMGVDDPDYRDQILVTDSQGALHMFLLKTTKNGRLIGGQHNEVYHLDAPGASGNAVANPNVNTGLAINPPTVYDGLAYMADTTEPGSPGTTAPVGRVWVADLTTGLVMSTKNGPSWVVGGPGTGGTSQPGFTASPTIGYIPSSDGSGSTQRVLYGPGVSTQNFQPTIVSLWLGAKGEKPFSATCDGAILTITTQAGATSQAPIYLPSKDGAPSPAKLQMAPRLSIVDSNGNPLDVGAFVGLSPSTPSPGVLTYSWNPMVDYQTGFVDKGYSFRIDYSVDWGLDPTNNSATIERGRLLLPIKKTVTGTDTSERIMGPIALTPQGTMHMVESPFSLIPATAGAGGSYFAIREDGGRKGVFRVVSRYSLYPQHTETVNNVSNVVPPVLADQDGVKQFVKNFPGYIENMTGFRYAGGIALRNGIAYATINASHGFIPVTMVAAFRAEPQTPEIRIGTDLGVNPSLRQVDVQRNPLPIPALPTYSTLTANQMTVDTANGIIRLDNLANVTAGEITDCINLSQPVMVSWQSRLAFLRTPDAEGDLWTPMLWFGLWNGGTAVGGPLVAGNEVYIAANSALPNILNSPPGGPLNLTSSGVVWSIDADISTNNTYSLANPARPWLVQQDQILLDGSGNFSSVSPYYRMPQNRGVTSFDDYKLRLSQTKMGNSLTAKGIAGGDGTVTAFGSAGLYGLSRADFVVCDEGRLLRVDSSGNPISSAFGGRFSGVGNGSASSTFKPLVRPVKAYPVGDNDFLVVDAGGNRVVRLDEDGNELRSIDTITLDPVYKPLAYRANEPLTFNDPRDATTYEGYVYLDPANPLVTGQNPVEYWVRTIVADSGNGRIVELADRYQVDAQGNIGAPVTLTGQFDPLTNTMTANVAQVGVLVWQSPSLEQATKIGDYYNSISRVFIGSINTGRYVYVTGVSRTRPTRSSAGLDNPNVAQRPNSSGGGAIVVFDPLGGTRVFDRFGLKDTTNTAFFHPSTTNIVQGPFDTGTSASHVAQDDRPFSGLQAVSSSTVIDASGNVSIRMMATDLDAVYEFTVDSTVLGGTGDPTLAPTGTVGNVSLTPSWYMNEAAYTALRQTTVSSGIVDVSANPKFFRPAYARRLDSGDVLLVNGYRGVKRDNVTAYKGEVVLIDGTSAFNWANPNLGFLLGSIHFDISTLNGSARDIISPVFADRK